MADARQKYALITGAASGMGRCYVEQLIERGYGILAIDCNQAALSRLCDDMARSVRCTLDAVAMDLSQPDAAEQLVAYVDRRGYVVDVLVCNAGALTFGGFVHLAVEQVECVVALHVATHTKLVRLLGERMCRSHAGFILWVASVTAWMPYPSIALYAATKSYVRTLSLALHDEWAHEGVSVTVVLPGAVDTSFYQLDERARRWLLRLHVMLTPDEVARRALRALFARKRSLTPGWFAKLMRLAGWLVPSCVIRRVVRLACVKKLLA